MPQYLVAIYRSDDYDPSVETEEMSREISALNEEMVARGVRKFVAGLSAPGTAGPYTYEPCDTDPMPDYENVLTD